MSDNRNWRATPADEVAYWTEQQELADAEIAYRESHGLPSLKQAATSTPLPLPRIPAPWAGNLSLSLAYCVGRRSARLGEHLNPYPAWTEQAKAWDAGRAAP